MVKIIRYILILIIGSFLGNIVEEVWCLIKNKKFEKRQSLIYSPSIPIYGIASLFMILIIDKIGNKLWKIFIVGLLIVALVEYTSSFLQEKIFHTKSWDYSDMKYNFHGRINLVYLIAFGIISILFVNIINYIIEILFATINYKLLKTIILLLTIFFIFDTIVSYLACLRQKNRREKNEAKNKLDKLLDKRFPDERLNKIYSNSVYSR